jgi:hypothetical protein
MNIRSAVVTVLAALTLPAWAQMTPVGRWHTIDDQTKELKSEVVITEKDGVLTGRIEKLLRKGADPNRRCTACTDDRKDQPMVGLEIIRGVRKVEGKDVWEGGHHPRSRVWQDLQRAPDARRGRRQAGGARLGAVHRSYPNLGARAVTRRAR